MAEGRRIEDLTLLVTGGAGFIGSNFIHYILSHYPHCKIINLDKLTYAGNLDNLKDIEEDTRYEFIHGDIRIKKLFERFLKKSMELFILRLKPMWTVQFWMQGSLF